MRYYTVVKYVLVCVLLFMTACAGSVNGYLSVNGEHFIDDKGRTVILNGINHVTKDPQNLYLNDNDETLFRQFREWGFNCVRYGIYWDGLEPQPGKINETYLKEIDKRVKWAEENNLWLILDMHQDLYGRKYGNGAPLWATLDENLPHETGDVWSDAYLVSPAIHKAFDHFWENTPAADGIGLQDHYIFVWKTLAKRYANSPSVAGFDIMNEPFMGSDGIKVLPKLLEGYAHNIMKSTGEMPSEADLVDLWGNEEKRIMALSALNNKEEYQHIVDNAYEEVREFEQGTLSRFYQRVRDAIREVNKQQIIFLEHTYFCNLGVKSSFHMPKDKNNNQDPLCAYAPHGYDLVTDTRAAATPNYNRVAFIFEQIFNTGKEKGVPVLIGEWGAYYMGGEYLQPATHLIGLFEQNLAGQTYWSYWDKIETQDYFSQALSRCYPMRTNGKLVKYNNDYTGKSFSCTWEEADTDKPTCFYIPDIKKINPGQIKLNPVSDVRIIPFKDSKAGYMEIQPIKQKRSVAFSLNTTD